jgi:cobalt-zinc-cadmium efflux system protein
MLEDVLGWVVVLVGAIVIRFTNLAIIDPLMSIGVAVFIFVGAVKNLGEMLDLFLEKTPHGISVDEIKEHLCELDGVQDVHHIHVWSMDGQSHYATLHLVVADGHDGHAVKESVREELKEHGIGHVTLELEAPGEHCHEVDCHVEHHEHAGHHHHHH